MKNAQSANRDGRAQHSSCRFAKCTKRLRFTVLGFRNISNGASSNNVACTSKSRIFATYSNPFVCFFFSLSWLLWGVDHINSWGRLEASGGCGCGRRIAGKGILSGPLFMFCTEYGVSNHPATHGELEIGGGVRGRRFCMVGPRFVYDWYSVGFYLFLFYLFFILLFFSLFPPFFLFFLIKPRCRLVFKHRKVLVKVALFLPNFAMPDGPAGYGDGSAIQSTLISSGVLCGMPS